MKTISQEIALGIIGKSLKSLSLPLSLYIWKFSFMVCANVNLYNFIIQILLRRFNVQCLFVYIGWSKGIKFFYQNFWNRRVELYERSALQVNKSIIGIYHIVKGFTHLYLLIQDWCIYLEQFIMTSKLIYAKKFHYDQ